MVSDWVQIAILINALFSLRISKSHAVFGFSFTKWPKWKIGLPGSTVELECVTNLEPDNIVWLHNHKQIYNLSMISSVGKHRKRLSIDISTNPEIYRNQEGLYQCIASFGSVSLISLPGKIEVAYLERFSDSRDEIIETTINDSVTISCSLPKSLPRAKVIFYKNESLINMDNDEYFVTENGDLVILTAKERMAGRYTCAAYNSALKKSVKKNSLTVVSVSKSKKHFETFIFIYKNIDIIIKGNTVKFLCLQHGHLHPRYSWFFKNYTSNLKQYLIFENSPILEIAATQSGTYECVVQGMYTTSGSKLHIYVQESPEPIGGSSNITLDEGGKTSLGCNFRGTPEPTISWVFNGNFIANSYNLFVIENEIHINKASLNQTGIYQCFAFNPLGAASLTSVVVVVPKTVNTEVRNETNLPSSYNYKNVKMKKYSIGKRKKKNKVPVASKPSIKKISDESVLVRWNFPRHYESHLLFFKIQYKMTKKYSRWKTVDIAFDPYIRSFEVRSLKYNQFYRFRIATVYTNNDHKIGRSSEKFFLKKSVHLKPPPHPPVNLSFTYFHNSVEIMWKFIETVPIEGFVINYRRPNETYTKLTLLGNAHRNFEIRNLEKNSTYHFRMSSFNMAGMSDYSPIKIMYSQKQVLKKIAKTTTIVPFTSTRATNLTFHVTLTIGIFFLVLIISFITAYTCYAYRAHKEPQISVTIPKNYECSYSKENGAESDEKTFPLLENTTSFCKINKEFIVNFNENRK